MGKVRYNMKLNLHLTDQIQNSLRSLILWSKNKQKMALVHNKTNVNRIIKTNK